MNLLLIIEKTFYEIKQIWTRHDHKLITIIIIFRKWPHWFKYSNATFCNENNTDIDIALSYLYYDVNLNLIFLSINIYTIFNKYTTNNNKKPFIVVQNS